MLHYIEISHHGKWFAKVHFDVSPSETATAKFDEVNKRFPASDGFSLILYACTVTQKAIAYSEGA